MNQQADTATPPTPARACALPRETGSRGGTAITIKDVAAASGVSPATVSQALGSGRRHVCPATRERVLRVASELRYQPNAIARGLVKRRMNTIGLAFPHWQGERNSNAYLMALLDGVLNVCVRREQLASLCVFSHWDAAENTVALTDGRCDGVLVLVPPAGCSLVTALQEQRTPLVLVNGRGTSDRMAAVDVNNVEGTRCITKHLLDLGHRRIAFYSRDFDAAFPFLHERREGYLQAMCEAGLSSAARFLSEEHEGTLYRCAPDTPTAVVCAFDNLALGLMGRLQDRGLRVPEDLSVAGFDDIPASAFARPPLTSVRQPVKEIGERAVELLLGLVEATDTPRQEYLPTELVIRQSTAPPRQQPD